MSNKSNNPVAKKSITEKSNSSTKNNVVEMKTPSIKDIQKLLDSQIEKFQHKSELIKNRDRFLKTKNNLTDYIKEQGADYDPFLDNDNLKLVLSDRRNYREDSVSISNNLLIREFVEFLINKINLKVSQIEKEILG